MKYRDITIQALKPDEYLAVICDSYGGIGNLPMDQIHVSPQIVGYYTAMLCLKECASIQAKPFCLVNLVSASFEPTGKGILAGIQEALTEAGLGSLPVNGSSEENFKAVQTGGGMTLLATLDRPFELPQIRKGDQVYLVGEPSVGDAVIRNRDRILTLDLIRELVAQEGCIELVPLGSGGLSTEKERYETLGTNILWNPAYEEYNRSAGPATAALVVYRGDLATCETPIPIRRIGRVES